MIKKVVLFGGSGFLGSYLADELIKDGYKNNNRKMANIEKTDDLSCSICYDSIENGFVRLDCGHFYHDSCIREAINTFFAEQSSDYFKCPYCSRRYFHTEVI